MNTVAVNNSLDLTYGRIEPGSVFGFIQPGGHPGAPCFKLETGYVYLGSGEEYQYPDRDNSCRDLKCRLLQSVTITRD